MEAGQENVAAGAAQPESGLSHCCSYSPRQKWHKPQTFSSANSFPHSQVSQQGTLSQTGSSWAFRKQIQHVQVNNLILASSCSVLWTLPLLCFQCCPFITFFSLKYQGWIVQAEASQAGGGSLRDCCEERALLFIVGDGALPPLTSLVDYSSMSTDLTCRTCQECLPCGLALCWLGQHLCQHRRCSRSLRLSKEKLPLSAQAAAKHQAGSPQLLPPKLLLTTNKQ